MRKSILWKQHIRIQQQCFLYDNESDGFSPISTTVRNELLGIDGVNKKASCILEGAYMNVSMARKAYLPLENVVRENEIIKEGVGFSTEYEMVENASQTQYRF